MQEERGYTIVIVPAQGGKIQRYGLGPERLRTLVAVAVVLLCLFGLTTAYSVYNLAQLPARWRADAQLEAQRLHLADLQAQLADAQATLDRVARLDRKLRVVLGEGVADQDRTVLGIGGPGPEQSIYEDVLDRESRLELARLDTATEALGINAQSQELNLLDLSLLLGDQAARLASTPSVWPTRGWVTSTFGMRTSPFTGAKKLHEGIDIATRSGNPVIATADGTVLFAGVRAGYGKLVIIDHGFGITTRYGHLSSIETTAGEVVRRGTLVGRVGNTGRSTGPHLHYEVRVDGAPVDPYRYILVEDTPLP